MARVGLGLAMLVLVLMGCSTPPAPPARPMIGVVIDSDSENDRSFNEYTLKGAQAAARELGLEFTYVGSQTTSEYDRNIEQLINDGADLVITVGFRIGEATARMARAYPAVRFAIVDNAYTPGAGCATTVTNCYSPEGGLTNVTSLMFAEDQIGYLAGVLAACMSETGTIASVAGVEIPPVVRFVNGYRNGALAVRPAVVVLNRYIPDFNDPATGKVVAQDFIAQGADVIFGVGGNTGNGGLLAAYEAEVMAIGVDMDQYYTYPEVAPALLSSAVKNVDVAAANAVKRFAVGELMPGVETATLLNGGIGLAPFHDWEERIPQSCKDELASAETAIKAEPTVTGVR